MSRVRAAFALAIVAAPAAAQFPAGAFPNRPLRLVTPFPAGGPVDLAARTLGPRLAELLGQPVIVDNRAGAATIIGTEAVARAPADGHALLLVTSGIAINPAIHRRLPYDSTADLAPVSQVLASPFILIAHPALPARTVREFVALARRRPAELMYPSSGIGGANHLAGVLFDSMAGVRTTHVPYKGTVPGITELMAGHVHFQFSNPLGSVQHVRAGRLRMLAVAGPKRSPQFPDTPTVAEAGVPGYESGVWFGLFTTGGTPRDTIARLHAATVRVLGQAEVRQKLSAEGGEVVGSGPEEFARFFRAEIAKWSQVVAQAGIKPE